MLLASLTIGELAPRLLGDAGIGWHIRNGQLMLATHSITRADSFSSTMSGQPWYAWEWLYDAGIAGVHHAWGLNGVVFITALMIALSFTLLFRLMLARGTGLPLAVILLVLAVGASAIHLFARPHVVSWLLTLIWYQVLDTAEDSGDFHRLWWLPVITVLWVNLHGGFVVGFVLLAIHLLAGAIRHREKLLWIKRLSLVTGLSFLASFVNPYGYKLHVHVYQYLTNRFLMDHIDEFSSPNFHGVGQQCFLALLLISIVALAVRREEVRWPRLLVMLFAAYSGLYASRNLPVSSMLLGLIAGPMLSRAIVHGPGVFAWVHAFSERMGAMEFRSRGHLWPPLVMLLGVAVCIGQGRLGDRQVMNAHFDGKRFPVQAAAAMESAGFPQTVFAPDYWGGYLIYRFYPRMKVVVDDRHDLYGEAFLQEYLTTIHVAPEWKKMLDDKQVEWVLLPEGSSLANALRESRWKVRYSDDTAVLLQK